MTLEINKELTAKLFDTEGLSFKELLCLERTPWHWLDELEAFVEKNGVSDLGPDVFVEGRVFVGKGTIIRKGACLRGPVVIGERCVIGHHVEIVRSLIFDEAKIPHLNYVGDTIVGSRVNMGAGSICANMRFDKGEIFVGNVNTQRRKLGALIGDDASIGCNAVLNPGTIVLPRKIVMPCKNVGGIIQ